MNTWKQILTFLYPILCWIAGGLLVIFGIEYTFYLFDLSDVNITFTIWYHFSYTAIVCSFIGYSIEHFWQTEETTNLVFHLGLGIGLWLAPIVWLITFTGPQTTPFNDLLLCITLMAGCGLLALP